MPCGANSCCFRDLFRMGFKEFKVGTEVITGWREIVAGRLIRNPVAVGLLDETVIGYLWAGRIVLAATDGCKFDLDGSTGTTEIREGV